LTLLSSLDALRPGLLGLLPLLLRLLGSSLRGLLIFRSPCLRASKLLAPLLLLLGLDLAEEIAGGSNLVAYGQGACFPVVGDDEEFGVELG
jgi:hypothetical protein